VPRFVLSQVSKSRPGVPIFAQESTVKDLTGFWFYEEIACQGMKLDGMGSGVAGVGDVVGSICE
jgi:hypothetical protein